MFDGRAGGTRFLLESPQRQGRKPRRQKAEGKDEKASRALNQALRRVSPGTRSNAASKLMITLTPCCCMIATWMASRADRRE